MKKKRLLIALFALIGIALVGATFTKAAETNRNITQNMSPGQSITIPKTGWTFDAGSVVECDTSTLTNIVVEETSTNYKFKYDGTGSGSEKVSCVETAGNGSVHKNVIVFKFKSGASMTIRGAQSEDLDSNGDIMKQFGFIKYITGASVLSGGEYINLDCNPGSYCHVRASSQAYDDNEHQAQIEITYQDANGNESSLKIDILIDVWGSARFYPGGYAECHFESAYWTAHERGTYSNNVMFYYPKTDGTVPVPICGDGGIIDTTGLPIRFAGWVKTNISLRVQTQGKCSSGELGEFIGFTGNISGLAKGNYHSCFEYEPMVRISTGGAKLTDSGWISTRTAFDGLDSGIYYKTAESSSVMIALPTTLEYEFSLSSRKKIVAWVKSTGERLEVSSNPSVPADGSVYYAVYDYTITGTNRAVYEGSSDRITLSGFHIISCSTPDGAGYLTAQMIGDECIITGEKATESPVTVILTIEGQDTPAEYTVTVLPDYGEFGEGFVFDPYIQDEGLFQENTGKNGLKVGANECQSFEGLHLCNYGSSGTIPGSSIQSSAYAAKCNDTGETFVTACLDPGAPAPSGEYVKDRSGINIPGIRSMVEELKTDLSNGTINTSDFTSANCGNSATRDGVNSAFRVAMIHAGFSFYSSLSSYQRFSAAAGLLPDVDSAAASVFDLDSGCSGTACQIFKRYLEAYVDPKVSEEDKWELSKETDFASVDSNSYVLEYKGEIIGPDDLQLDTSHVEPGDCGKFGYSCEMEFTGEVEHDAEKGVNKYHFIATMTVNDAKSLDVPSTDQEKAEASFRIQIQGGKLADVFLLAPASGAEMQRLLVFDLDTDGIMVYLSPAPASCLELDATKFEVCNGPNWETECNYELFVEAGCCSLINDEEKWENIFNNICSNNCSQNTVGQVCEFVPNSPNGNGQTQELYHIHEGYKFNAETGEYEEDLGQCIVKTDVKYSAETKASALGIPATDVTSNFDKFTTYDSRENLMNSQEYAGNRYCQVICKEDWDISMGAFGNFMGNEAVVAGSYFSINQADIFVKGQRSCYTTFLYPKQYIEDMREYAKDLINGYNDYSNVAHSMTAFDFEDRKEGQDSFTYYKYKAGTSKDSTYDEPKSANVKICRNYENVTVTKTSCSTRSVSCGKDGKSTCCEEYNCTTTTWTSSDECTVSTTASEHFGCSSSPHTPFTDMEYDLPHIEWFQISAKYNDGHAGAGKYEKYQVKTDGVGSKTPTAYDQWKDTLTCTATKNGKRDDVYCSGTYTPSFQALKASEYTKDTATSELDKKVDERIIGKRTNNLDQDSGEEGLGIHGYYDAVKQKLKEKYDAAVAKIRVAQGNLQSAANQWFKCEYFAVYTSNYAGDDELAKGELSPSMKAIGTPGTPGMIGTEYDPIVTYSYDERNYMNILANERNDITGHVGANMLIPYVDKNGYTMGEPDGLGSVHTPTEIRTGIASEGPDGIQYVTEGNYIDYSWKEKEMFNAGGYDGTPWTKGSESNKKYTGNAGSGSVETKPVTFCMIGDWTANDKGNSQNDGGTPFTPLEKANPKGWVKEEGGHCYTSNVEYLGDVNYIKKTVSNSAYYKNKGRWFSGVNGTVAHGDDALKAIQNINELSGSNYAESDLDQWGSIGNLNVFPVAMTTPRNLYVYTYLFANIGSYLDGQAGRLMGDDDSVFQNNTRSCFYEVVETICVCCGDPVEYHTVDSKGVEAEVRENYAKDHGMSSKTSDPDKIKTSKKGQMGFYNTVSSLTSLSALNEEGKDRSLAANWGDQSIFNYNGYNRYVTNKGDIAAKAIEAVGEEIYAGDGEYQAEYAYRLTPDAISTIRTYNLDNSYGINYQKMNSYGQVLIVPEDGSYSLGSATEMANHINFQHYGSEFLETVMVPYVKEDNNMNLAERDDVCYIKESELSYNDSNPETYKNLSNAINNQMKSGCRWVDYIEEEETNPNGGGLDEGPFRLAFK